MKKQIVYLHVPKAAGTTLLDVARRQYEKSRFYKLRSRYAEKEWPELLVQDSEVIDRYDAFYGHYEFGVHADLSCPVYYVTMLREPVARVISLYKFMMNRLDSPFWDKRPKRELSLSEFVAGGYSKMSCDGQTRLMTGQNTSEPLQENSLELAIENIARSFIAVGVVERFDESLMLFREKLDWTAHCCYRRKNVGGKEKLLVSESDIKIIKQHNQIDIQLYEYVTQQFQQEIGENCKNIGQLLFRHRLSMKWYPVSNVVLEGFMKFGRSLRKSSRLTFK